MGGRASRRKGTRAEYLVRDALRKAGWQAERVPLSGASAYAKGDVKAEKNGRTVLFEVKNIAGAFQTVYRLFATQSVAGVLCLALGEEAGTGLVRICDAADAALESEGLYRPGVVGRQLCGKLLNMQKLLKGAEVLVIKDNHLPLLYLRYL